MRGIAPRGGHVVAKPVPLLDAQWGIPARPCQLPHLSHPASHRDDRQGVIPLLFPSLPLLSVFFFPLLITPSPFWVGVDDPFPSLLATCPPPSFLPSSFNSSPPPCHAPVALWLHTHIYCSRASPFFDWGGTHKQTTRFQSRPRKAVTPQGIAHLANRHSKNHGYDPSAKKKRTSVRSLSTVYPPRGQTKF